MSNRIQVSHVAGLIDVEHVEPGWLIRRRGAWCEVTGVQQSRPGWRDVFVREYVRPMEFAISMRVEVMAPVVGAESPSFVQPVSQVEPYPDGHGDGKLYLTRDQAALLVDLFRTHFPPDFENYETSRYVKSLTTSLISFAGKKIQKSSGCAVCGHHRDEHTARQGCTSRKAYPGAPMCPCPEHVTSKNA